MAKDVRRMATVGAYVVTHVLDHPQYRDVDVFEHVSTPTCVDERDVLHGATPDGHVNRAHNVTGGTDTWGVDTTTAPVMGLGRWSLFAQRS